MGDVIKQVLEGNKELYREIVREYYEPVYYFIKKQVISHDDALDITQEIFIKIYQNLNKYDEEKSSFKTWIYNVSANYCFDYFRSKTYKMTKLTEELEEEIYVYENMVEDIIQSEQIETIRLIMNQKLKKKQQLVMRLYYFAGLEVNEISSSLNIPIKTIYSILSSSINKIKKEMEEQYE